MSKASIKKDTMRKAARDEKTVAKIKAGLTLDAFQNFALNLGLGTNNALSGSTYGFNPITRIRTLLDWIHRGSWLGGVAIDLVADDMTRAGIELLSVNKPDDIETIKQSMTRLRVWPSINETVKWARLYGGCIAVILIDGQDAAKPLRLETVGKDKFRGLMVLDRWMVEPNLQKLVSELGPHLGLPEFYRVVTDAPALRNQVIHYSRVIRLEGIRLPYWQRIMENLWGISVLERLYDRMVSFDSATAGASQLVYKSYIRTYAIDGLKEALAAGGAAAEGIVRYVEMMRKFQGIEGISLIDAKDKFESHQVAGFAGISDVLLQLGQQLSGSLQIPMVRLFGQSPAGLNSTGESDLRTYYDGILQAQERDLREGINKIVRVTAQSEGIQLPDEFDFNFVPLWQLDEVQKSEVADRDSRTISDLEGSGLISEQVALKELRQLSKVTGRFTNITEEDVEAASDIPVPAAQEAAEFNAELAAEHEGEGEGDDEGDEDEAKAEEDGEPKGGAKAKKTATKPSKPSKGTKPTKVKDQLPLTEVAGFQIVIETRAGTIRAGRGWQVRMPCDYGYIRRTHSSEGRNEGLDCFVGPAPSSRDVWVVDTCDPDTGTFDEHKVMLGFRSSRDALATFRAAYNDGSGTDPSRRILGMRRFSADDLSFKNWVAMGDKSRPVTKLAGVA